MGITGGLISMAIAVALLWIGKPAKGATQRAIFESWPILVGFVILVLLLFVGGAAAVITNLPKAGS